MFEILFPITLFLISNFSSTLPILCKLWTLTWVLQSTQIRHSFYSFWVIGRLFTNLELWCIHIAHNRIWDFFYFIFSVLFIYLFLRCAWPIKIGLKFLSVDIAYDTRQDYNNCWPFCVTVAVYLFIFQATNLKSPLTNKTHA